MREKWHRCSPKGAGLIFRGCICPDGVLLRALSALGHVANCVGISHGDLCAVLYPDAADVRCVA